MRIIRLFASLYQQIILTVVIFVLMTGITDWYVYSFVQRQMKENGAQLVVLSRAQTQAFLRSLEWVLNGVAFALEESARSDDSDMEIQEMCRDVSTWLKRNDVEAYPLGCVNGKYIDDGTWDNPPDKYEPTNRPWYTNAQNKRDDEGRIAIAYSTYTSQQSGKFTVALSREIVDNDGASIGVIAIALDAKMMSERLSEIQDTTASYSTLADENFTTVAHRDSRFVGGPWENVGASENNIVNMLRNGEEVYAHEYKAYDGIRKLIYTQKLFNGWYASAIVPTGEYYRKINTMMSVITAMGLGFMTALCFLLVRLNRERDFAEDRNRSKSTFLAKMSHEIRTPMNAITGMSELILRESATLSPRVIEYATGIKHAGHNLLALINDILDFSKIESGRLEIIVGRYMLSSLISDVVHIIRPRLQEKHLRFTVYVDSTIPNHLNGDVTRVRQILLNLLSNAVKYTDAGGISVRVTGQRGTSSHGELPPVTLKIAITDTGVGIKSTDQSRLFNEFVRLDLTANNSKEGTGLGLAITRSFVNLMGGEINFDSSYGKGSTFNVTLPQQVVGEEPFAAVESPEKAHILLYEPRTTHAESLMETFTNLKLQCTLVASQADFYEQLEKNDYTLILTASFIYESVKHMIDQHASQTRLALFADVSDLTCRSDIPMLFMPIYSLPIANLINNNTQDPAFEDRESVQIRFHAPKARILVVDDIRVNLSVAEGLMLPYNMHIDLCLSGEEAVDMIRKNKYDIVFMDHMMPGMDGIDVTLKVRSWGGSHYSHLPIVAMTANVVMGMKEMFLQNGMNDFLPKPIEMSHLNRILARWIPKEKQEKKIFDLPRTEEQNLPLSVQGLDTRRGIAMSGSRDRYINMLRMFLLDAATKSAAVQESWKNGNLKKYTTDVHGLKSALASLGAAELSQQAALLETAGRSENRNLMDQETAPFLEKLDAFRDALEAALQTVNAAAKDEHIELLYDELSKLKDALHKMDAAAIHSIVDTLLLKLWSPSVQNMLNELNQHILMFDYDQAIKQITDYQGQKGH